MTQKQKAVEDVPRKSAAPKLPQVERPTWVKIGYARYTVDWLDDADWAREGHIHDANGMTESDQHSIKLRNNGRPEDHLRECLMHEMLHASWNAANLQNYSGQSDDEDAEEFIVGSLSMVLLGVLNDNPHVVAYLISNSTLSG